MITSTNFGMSTHVGLGCQKITMQNLQEYGTFGQVEVPETIFEKTFSGCFCSNSFEYGLESIVAEPNLFVVGRSNGKCLNVFFASGSASPAFALVSLNPFACISKILT